MKDYITRLKSHPGIFTASILTLLSFLAALGNESFSIKAAVIVGFLLSGIIWSVILISNFKKQ